MCAGIGLLKLLLVVFLTRNCEIEKEDNSAFVARSVSEESPLLPNADVSDPIESGQLPEPVFTRETFMVLIKICLLLALDSVGSGLVSQ